MSSRVGKIAVSWLKIVGLGLGLAAKILSHETATLSTCSAVSSDLYDSLLLGYGLGKYRTKIVPYFQWPTSATALVTGPLEFE